MASHYQVLGVVPTCSPDELRRAYHREARRLHPDKSADPADEQTQRFLRVQAAYETLRDDELRAAYDKALARDAARQSRQDDGVVVSDEIHVDAMQREVVDDDGEKLVILSHACRCGDVFEVTEEELEDGVSVVPCTGCSQHIRVLYAPKP